MLMTLTNGYKELHVNWASSVWTVSREKKGVDKSEGESSEFITVWWLQCPETLLDYMGQRWFKYSDITSTSNICIAMRSLKQFIKTSNHYKLLPKINVSYAKKYNLCRFVNAPNKIFLTNHVF